VADRLSDFVSRLRVAAKADPQTAWFDVVSAADIAAAEELLDLKLPTLLSACYREVSNGGFGPGQLIGLPGGFPSSWGDLTQTFAVLHEDEECEESWLPIVDWGCSEITLVDCDDLQIVTLYDGDFHVEDYTFDDLIQHWLDGELPELHSGGFAPKRC
jgi:hypothetical protein